MHRTSAELEAELGGIRAAPREDGRVELVVRRPDTDVREELREAELDAAFGLGGDKWSRGRTPSPDRQLTLMNARVIRAVAGSKARWALAGDQLFVDFDLSAANLPPGTRLQVGSAVIEITAPPHRACSKFQARFGADAVALMNSPVGEELNLRGVNARVVQAGVVRPGDRVRKLTPPSGAEK